MNKLPILNIQVSNRSFEAELQNDFHVYGQFYATTKEGAQPNQDDGWNRTPQYDVIDITLDDIEYYDQEGNELHGMPNQDEIHTELKSLLSGYV